MKRTPESKFDAWQAIDLAGAEAAMRRGLAKALARGEQTNLVKPVKLKRRSPQVRESWVAIDRDGALAAGQRGVAKALERKRQYDRDSAA